jgi:hypothetical protein
MHSGHYIREELKRASRPGDVQPLVEFVGGCLLILEALQEAGIVHNNLNAESFLVREVEEDLMLPVLVDAEIAAVPGLAAPTSCSMSHAREFHAAGAPSDAYTLGRSLQKLLHRENVTAFDCIIALLLQSIDTAVRHPHISHRRHPYAVGASGRAAQATYPVVDTQVAFDKLRELESALARGPLPRHMQCSLPLHPGWNAFHEVLPADQGFNGEDPLSLGLERAGAPPFEHNMGLYHLDSLLLGDPRPLSPDGDGKSGEGQGKQEARDSQAGGFEGGGVNPRKSGIPAHRLGDFFFNMGGELTSVQEDAMALFSEAAQGQLAFKAVALSNLFTASNALCCWQRHAQLSQHQHDALRNASLCLKGVAERCWGSRASSQKSADSRSLLP